jgi:hypothetical protein
MVAVCMGDDRFIDRFPGINIKIPGTAIQTFIGKIN